MVKSEETNLGAPGFITKNLQKFKGMIFISVDQAYLKATRDSTRSYCGNKRVISVIQPSKISIQRMLDRYSRMSIHAKFDLVKFGSLVFPLRFVRTLQNIKDVPGEIWGSGVGLHRGLKEQR
jgi:hypothetical protein